MSEGSKPGTLDVWVLVDTAMHRMTVTVPRTLYVDVEPDKRAALPGARQVERTLPDGGAAAALLELSMPEDEFIANAPVRTNLD